MLHKEKARYSSYYCGVQWITRGVKGAFTPVVGFIRSEPRDETLLCFGSDPVSCSHCLISSKLRGVHMSWLHGF